MSTRNNTFDQRGRTDPLLLDRILNAVIVFLVLYTLFTWLGQRFIIGHDNQATLCLDGGHRWYLIDRNQQTPEPGDLVAFRSDTRMAPEIPEGTLVVKRVEAIFGDAVALEPHGLRIQGQFHPINYPHRARLKARAWPQGTQWIIPDGSLWVMGDHPRAFDSRYFGPIEAHQIVGVAHVITL